MGAETARCREKAQALGCVAIIPTYNNAGTVEGVIRDVKQYVSDVIVVNDGSTDATLEILRTVEDVVLVSYPKNRGKGYALQKGMKEATTRGFRYAITIDADGQHFADDIPVFLDRIEQVPDSLLIGARNLAAENMPRKNTFANRFSNFWYKVETGRTLMDTQSGYRLYPLHKLRNMRFFSGRYEFEVEVMVRATWRGVNVENCPVKVYYPSAEERVSHFKPLKDFARISLLNTVLVLFALLVYYPWKFVRALTWANIKQFFDTQVVHCSDSNARMAAAMGWGVFCGIIPIWGYQMLFAGVSSHFMKLNKVVAVVFSNVSVPPMIPFILYGSMAVGALVLRVENPFLWGAISFEALGVSLKQYIVGSIVLATAAGVGVFFVAYVMMLLFRKGGRNG